MDSTPDEMQLDDAEGTAEPRVCPNPQCKFDKHAPGANFCILCGTLLYTHCEDCLANNPRYARFCYYCGSDLGELRLEANSRQANAE